MKKIYLTEQQFNYILEQQMLNEGIMKYLYQRFFGKCQNTGELVQRAIYWISAGIISFAIAVDIIQNGRDTGVLSNQDAIEVIDTIVGYI